MRMTRFFLASAFLTGIAAPGASVGQTNAQVAAGWGLLGTWKIDCDAPATVANTQETFVVRAGRLMLDRDLGSETDSFPVAFVAPGEGGTLYLVIQFTRFGQVRENVVVKRPDGRKRIVSNRDVDTDEYSVRNSAFTQSGRELSWFTRCTEPPARIE